jgi:hypothetical protein
MTWRQDPTATRRQSRLKIKIAALEAYGGVCACCGENDQRFLTLDHTKGDGATHRRELLGRGWVNKAHKYLVKLRSLGWPQDLGIQVLCANCHNAKDNWGGCPHQSFNLILTEDGHVFLSIAKVADFSGPAPKFSFY